MKIIKTIKVPTYSCELLLIITDQLKAESQKIYKKYKLTLEDDGGETTKV